MVSRKTFAFTLGAERLLAPYWDSIVELRRDKVEAKDKVDFILGAILPAAKILGTIP